jgi:Phosphotransferase enzyme family
MSIELVRRPEDVSADWLTAVLCDSGATVQDAAVRRFEASAIGTGQMSESYRFRLTWDGGAPAGPASVVLKVAASDETSRSTGVGLGIYEREIRFYQDVAPRVGGPVAACHLAGWDPSEGWFTLVLEDAAPAVQGDQITGCTVEEARLAVRELAKIHAPVWDDPTLGSAAWLNQPPLVNQAIVGQLLDGFTERYDARLSPEHRGVVERFVARLDPWLFDRRRPFSIVHGDYRLDNLLFGEPGSPKPLTVVDWQTVSFGPPLVDVSYFIGAGLEVGDRRAAEQRLVHEYHESLLALGVEGFTWEECWEEYRRQAFAGVLMAVVAPMVVVRTERGDDMFMTSLARHAQQVLDLDAEELLAAGTLRQAFPRPSPEHEKPQPPGSEELWNDSWYFDAVAEDGSLGAYVRIGLYPNLGVAWYTAYVTGPGRPAIAVIDLKAPLPSGDDLRIATGSFEAEHRCERPLERFAVTLEGEGEAHDDHSAPLRGEPGRPVAVGLDLSWETDGSPYAYRMTTRYEIPCRVHGTVRIDGAEIALSGPGQRDHSWGLRDWWSMDWVWSAARLDDGERVHAVQVRLPDGLELGVGYVQPAGAEPRELEAVEASERVAANGLVESARVVLQPAGLSLDIEPFAFGPLRLVSPDGRETNFPRAMCRFRSHDGRTGSGWAEWNFNQPPAKRP